MKAVIVCESMFGNTELLAEIVRKGLSGSGVEADVVEAVEKGADPRREQIGVREWLGSFTAALPDPTPAVAVFDTKVTKARHWPGSAARRTSRWLRKEGFDVLDCTSFYVEGIAGPLTPGEVERAGGLSRREP